MLNKKHKVVYWCNSTYNVDMTYKKNSLLKFLFLAALKRI